MQLDGSPLLYMYLVSVEVLKALRMTLVQHGLVFQ